MKYENSFNTVWTDGGRPANSGYFDRAGRFNDLLVCMFAGGECSSDKYPFSVNVMGGVRYDAKVKVTVTIEVVE